MEMYELYLEVMALSPKAELIGIKTDCLVFNKIEKDIELSGEIGDVKNVGYQEVIIILQTQSQYVVRTGTYDLEYEQWNNIEEYNINYVFQDG